MSGSRRWHARLAVPTGRRSHLGFDTIGPTPYAARITLREACETRGLSVYQVAMSGTAQGTLDAGTVYRLARGETSRIDLQTLAAVAGILHTLTGQPVSVAELLSLKATGAAVPYAYRG
ncbi:helix-turn-helix transcriptional regulator [Deinococcus sonorensis]|uniref:Helix-turn-helix transcriptional regulator n=2 Tax=Deinococcus sonorensis TaxID=309891 RepID=A0AAU7UBI9_9DEIO